MGPLNSENVLRMRESYSGAILFSPKADGLSKRGIWVPLVGGVKLGCAILQGVLSILLQTRTLHVALVPFYWAPKLGFRPGWSRYKQELTRKSNLPTDLGLVHMTWVYGTP